MKATSTILLLLLGTKDTNGLYLSNLATSETQFITDALNELVSHAPELGVRSNKLKQELALRPAIEHAVEATRQVLQPVVIPVVHHTVVATTPPPIIHVVHPPPCDCGVCPTCDCCQHPDEVAELAGKALGRLGGGSGTTVEGSSVSDVAKKALEKVGGGEKPAETVAELANRALESLGGDKPASKQDSLKDLADKALKKADQNSDSKSSSSSGDSVPELARRALSNLNLP